MTQPAGDRLASWDAALARDGQVEILPSRARMYRLLVISILFVLAGVLVVVTATSPSDVALGVAAMGLFGLGVPLAIRKLVRRDVALRVTTRAVEIPVRKGRILEVPWAEVRGASIWRFRRNRTLLVLVTQDFYDRRRAGLGPVARGLATANQGVTGQASYGVPGVGHLDDLVAWLNALIARQTEGGVG